MSKHYRSNLLSFDTFSKFQITPLQYFNGDSLFFSYLNKDNTHTNIIYQFFKISRVHFFLKSKFSAKSSVFPIIFHIKMLHWTRILRSPPFHYNRGEVWFFAHRYTRNTINITYAKIKKNSRSRFLQPQPARAFLSFLFSFLFFLLFVKLMNR